MAKAQIKPNLSGLPKRVGVSIAALAKLLYFRPAYLFLAIAVSIVFYELVYWFLNLSLAKFLFTTPYLSMADRIDLIVGSYTGMFMTNLTLQPVILFAVSLLQGATVAALVYTIRRERQSSKGLAGTLGGSGLAGALAVLGLGCAACGTSLIVPILAFFFASSSFALAEAIGFWAIVLALPAAMVACYLAGLRLSTKR